MYDRLLIVIAALSIFAFAPLAAAQGTLRGGNASSVSGPTEMPRGDLELDANLDIETRLKLDPGYKSAPVNPSADTWVDSGDIRYQRPGTLEDEYGPMNSYSGLRLRMPFSSKQ